MSHSVLIIYHVHFFFVVWNIAIASAIISEELGCRSLELKKQDSCIVAGVFRRILLPRFGNRPVRRLARSFGDCQDSFYDADKRSKSFQIMLVSEYNFIRQIFPKRQCFKKIFPSQGRRSIKQRIINLIISDISGVAQRYSNCSESVAWRLGNGLDFSGWSFLLWRQFTSFKSTCKN